MILLDTHVWLWWLHDSNRLSNRIQNSITQEESQRLDPDRPTCAKCDRLVCGTLSPFYSFTA